jgi:hypothetical protein
MEGLTAKIILIPFVMVAFLASGPTPSPARGYVFRMRANGTHVRKTDPWRDRESEAAAGCGQDAIGSTEAEA